MVSKQWAIPPKELSIMHMSYAFTSGATLVHPAYFPREFTTIGINPRNTANNDFWGSIVTKPTNNKLVFGFVYWDKKEQRENEDIYVADLSKKIIDFYSRGRYERINPLYAGTHKGLKDFLKPKNP